MKSTGLSKAVSLFLMMVLFQSLSQAGIISEKKRIIFKGGDKELTLMIANTNAYPVIMQTWIDDGNIHNVPTMVASPFIIIPPMASLTAGEIKALRIVYNTQKALPTDRESAFWVNLYEIPPSSNQSKVVDNITVAMNTQIKLFYRPEKLIKKPDEKILAQQLVCRAITKSQNITIECSNPSPYFVSLSSVELHINSHTFQNETQLDMMVPPFSKNSYEITTNLSVLPSRADVLYSFIGDNGDIQGVKATIDLK